jgi:hypothetical protein
MSVLVFAFVMIFPKIILSNQTPKTPALDFDEHTDTQQYKTTTDDFRKKHKCHDNSDDHDTDGTN